MTSPRIRAVTTLLEVFDLPASLAFYRALGCEVAAHWGDSDNESEWDWVRLRLGEAELMLNTRYERDTRPPAEDAARRQGHADTELFFDCEDIESLCERLRRNGVEAGDPETTCYGTRRVCLSDPDGFMIWFEAPLAR